MQLEIKKVGVIGAGVMGAAIAAHMANCGLKVILLDVLPGDLESDLDACSNEHQRQAMRNIVAQKGLQRALISKPASFYVPEDADLIELGNLVDHICRLDEADWVIEAVVEDLQIKRRLFKSLEQVCNPQAIITSNTSGLLAADLASGLDHKFKKRFFCTHFFNPPRYLKLLELVPCPETDSELLYSFKSFAENTLGKAVVLAKDTPGFIANRIGVFSGCLTISLMDKMGLSIGDVDRLTGALLGRPKTATYRLIDLAGLDIFAHIAESVYKSCPRDERRQVFDLPAWFRQLLRDGRLGDKTGQGFYKKTGNQKAESEVSIYDPGTQSYRKHQTTIFNSAEALQASHLPAQRIRGMYYADDQAGQFIFKLLSETLIYAANRIPEISDDLFNLDNAVKWGFDWQLGPFEIWDALGVFKSSRAMQKAGYKLPVWVAQMQAAGCDSFYKKAKNHDLYYDLRSGSYQGIKASPYIILLSALKERERTVIADSEASLIDLDDGVACLEFYSPSNTLNHDTISFIGRVCQKVESDFQGLVIANQGGNFCAGMDLVQFLSAAKGNNWNKITELLKKYQDIMLDLKYLSRPVVAAPHGLTLGAGCELMLHCDLTAAAAETYAGFNEAGAGLIPAGGGCTQMLLRNCHEKVFKVPKGGVYGGQINLLPFVARAFESISMAKVSSSAKDANKIGILRVNDRIIINPDHRIQKAKNMVLALCLMDYEPAAQPTKIRVMGGQGVGALKYAAYTMHKAGQATEHDLAVANKLAWVLTGGDLMANTEVSEDYLMELEREAFLSLCGMPKTRARMEHMLKTGKPLRN